MTLKPRNKKIVIFSAVLLIIGIAVLIAVRGNEDTWIKDANGNWVMHGHPAVHDFHPAK